MKSSYRHIKRLFDFLLSLIAIAILSPFLLIVYILLAINTKQVNAFFVQKRIGHNCAPFYVFKFKTMTEDRDANGQLLPDAMRITRMGNFLRNYSIDELPQLINILNGSMSFIGPRPLLEEYLPLYNATQIRRHEVKPGITGWAQVNGRNAISWKQKFELDVWYVDNMSFTLDVKILWMTFLKVLRSEGISSATSATMEKFTGN